MLMMSALIGLNSMMLLCWTSSLMLIDAYLSCNALPMNSELIELCLKYGQPKSCTSLVARKYGTSVESTGSSTTYANTVARMLRLGATGTGRCGIVLSPGTKEEVLPIKEGDALALPYRVLTWWLNSSDTELVVLFIGDTSKDLQHGSLTNFHRTGSNGSFTGFTPVVIEHAGGLPEDQAQQLASSQTIRSVVKVKDWQKIPEPCSKAREGMVWNCLEAPLDVDIKDGGSVVVLNASNLPLVGKVGLGAYLVRIDGFSMFSPGFSCGSTYQVAYIVRGSGRVQIVGADGKRVLEAHVSDGYLFVVPKFSAVSMIADADGMEWLSIITAANPKVRQLVPVCKAVSPEILKAASNKAPET